MDYIEFSAKIEPLEVGRDILIAQLSDIGFDSFVETATGLNGYINAEEYSKDNIDKLRLSSNSEFKLEYTTKLIKDQNWNKTWEENFDPIMVGNQCFIRAPFHSKRNDVKFDIVINPQMSFGTGHHETTHLMVERMLEIDLEGKSILDMGCGTGVLAILAAKKKAGYIEAIDIDDWAYNNTVDNIRNNSCEGVVVKKGGAELLSELTFDCILANINRNILLNDMSKYVSVLKSKGDILFSGFFSTDAQLLCDEAGKYDLSLNYSDSRNDWTILHFIKN